MTAKMERREFITLLGGAAAWPFAVRAQQPAPGKWRLGLLAQTRRQDVLRQGLRELGYLEGNNLVIDARPNDRPDRLETFAAELVGLKAACDCRGGDSGGPGGPAGNQKHSDRPVCQRPRR